MDFPERYPIINECLEVMRSGAPQGDAMQSVGHGLKKNRAQGFCILAV